MLLLAIAIGVAAVVTADGRRRRRAPLRDGSVLSRSARNLLIVLPGKSETSGGGGIQGLLIGETARELTLDDTIALSAAARVRAGDAARGRRGHGVVGARERDITRRRHERADGARSSTGRSGSGRFLPPRDLDAALPVCVLGHTVARELFAGAQPASAQWMRIGDARCRVIGVLAAARARRRTSTSTRP